LPSVSRCGDDPVYVANQLGHTEPGFSMKVYASAVRRRERLIGVALREFDAALEWAAMGSGEPVSVDLSRTRTTHNHWKRLSRASSGNPPR
jgi:hypothetical protein